MHVFFNFQNHAKLSSMYFNKFCTSFMHFMPICLFLCLLSFNAFSPRKFVNDIILFIHLMKIALNMSNQ